jgi:hypothetical protein
MEKYKNAGWILAIFFAGLFLGSVINDTFESTAQAQQGVVSQQTERRIIRALEEIARNTGECQCR